MFFFIEWIYTYVSTSQYNMTMEIEILGLFGIGILATLIIGVVCLIVTIIMMIKKARK